MPRLTDEEEVQYRRLSRRVAKAWVIPITITLTLLGSGGLFFAVWLITAVPNSNNTIFPDFQTPLEYAMGVIIALGFFGFILVIFGIGIQEVTEWRLYEKAKEETLRTTAKRIKEVTKEE